MRGHVRKRGATWTVVYDEGHDENGRRRQRSKGGFATRRDAQRFLTDVLSRLGDGSYAQPSKVTLAEFLNGEWLPAVEGTVRPRTFIKQRSAVKARIVPRLGHVRLQALTGGHLNAFYRELEQAGLSVVTIRNTHAVLHRALRDAVRWGKLVRNPAGMADPPRAERSRAQAWTAKELVRFLEHVQGDRLFPLWRLAATTGMRRGELLGLTWRCLDLEGARLAVEQQLVPTVGGCTFGPPKSARSRRTVALDADTVAALREHREAQLLERDFAGPAYVDADLVFADELGGIDSTQLADRVVWEAPEGGRHPHRDAAHPSAYGRHAGAHGGRPRSHRRRPAGRRPENGALHLRAPAATVGRAWRPRGWRRCCITRHR